MKEKTILFAFGSTCLYILVLFILKPQVFGQVMLAETLPAIGGESAQTSLKVTQLDPAQLYVVSYEKTGGDGQDYFIRQNIETDYQEQMVVAYQQPQGVVELTDKDNVVFQTDEKSTVQVAPQEFLTFQDTEKLKNMDYLRQNFYTVDSRTDMSQDLFQVDYFLGRDLSIDTGTGGPKVLIFHTHANEMYIDSKGPEEGVIGVGNYLKELLENQYQIPVLHDTNSYQTINGSAYEDMEVHIQKVLAENPTIEVMIDVHRDGVADSGQAYVAQVNGKEVAQIMFVNGLSKIYRQGVLSNIDYLPNPYVKENLAFSFRLQLLSNEKFPGFNRKIYLHAYRYSLHMREKSMLLEVGNQKNTFAQAKNSMEPFAQLLAQTILQSP